MTDAIYRCPDHGYVTAESCPKCGDQTERVLSGDRRRRLSKFVSGALRHFPGDAGLELDERGRTDYADLERAVTRTYDWASSEHLAAVVATDPKGRFERESRPDGDSIRAAYGHSVAVNLEGDDGDGDGDSAIGGDSDDVPARLYHGTDPANRESILGSGLKPMGRQKVHLSETVSEARKVGSRHAESPLVFEVDAEAMLADGRRIAKRGEETYTTDEVPPTYLSVRDR